MEDTIKNARQAEKDNNWELAEKLWRLAGLKDHADICKTIKEANQKGDAYRADVEKIAGPEPDKTVNPDGWVRWYDKMSEIYYKHYPLNGHTTT